MYVSDGYNDIFDPVGHCINIAPDCNDQQTIPFLEQASKTPPLIPTLCILEKKS